MRNLKQPYSNFLLVLPEKPKIIYEHTCTQCGKIYVTQYRRKKRKYCSLACFGKNLSRVRRKYFNNDGTPMTPAQSLKWKYHNEPGFKERHKVNYKKWIVQKMKDPVYRARHKELQNKYSKAYYLRKKHENNP